MTAGRAIAACLAIALGIEALLWTTGTTSPLAAVLGWSKYLPLVLLGFLLGRHGQSYRAAFAGAWPFALVWTVFFYFRVRHPDVPVAAEELAATREAGLLPFGIFLLLSMILACVAAAAGVWLAAILSRRAPVDAGPPPAGADVLLDAQSALRNSTGHREDSISRIRPRSFVHAVYRTRRFEQMLDWYQFVFDAHVQHRNPALAFLTYDDEHHRFAFINLSVLQPDGAETDKRGLIGVDHVAYTYDSLAALFENYAQLKAKGIEPYWCIHHGITVSMYFADPDGNQMEFQVDAFASNDEANAFMGGPGYGANPIGVEYDPEAWLARLRAGAPDAEFLVRRVHEPVSPIRGAMGG